MAFKVGETVVYPHHGAALIEKMKTRTIKGEDKIYLVLKVAQGDLTIEVPAENCDLVGVRGVCRRVGGEERGGKSFWGVCARSAHRGADQLVTALQGQPREARVWRCHQGRRGCPPPQAGGKKKTQLTLGRGE